jgi:hypothetical protein
MAGTWHQGDGWWRVGEDPDALVRVGAGGPAGAPVREVVLVEAGPDRLEELLGAAAAAIGLPLRASLPAAGRPAARGIAVPVRRAVLPWPRPDRPRLPAP